MKLWKGKRSIDQEFDVEEKFGSVVSTAVSNWDTGNQKKSAKTQTNKYRPRFVLIVYA